MILTVITLTLSRQGICLEVNVRGAQMSGREMFWKQMSGRWGRCQNTTSDGNCTGRHAAFDVACNAVNCFVNKGSLLYDQVIMRMCLNSAVCLLTRQCTVIERKDTISEFHVSQGSSEAPPCEQHSFNGLFSMTIWVSRYQKDNSFWFLKDHGVAVTSAGPYASHLHLAPDR